VSSCHALSVRIAKRCRHALQLRQAKLSFPYVHLLVGVVSDQLCADFKSAPAMTHAERCEGVRHCRWADEILPDAPWVVDQAWLEKHNIDYIAHDELVYPSKGHEDVYEFAKAQGELNRTLAVMS
jgi:choline-phosphate cytidylyltransferase